MAAGSNVCRTFTIQVDAIGQFFWRVESYLTISGSQRPEILPVFRCGSLLRTDRSHSRWWQIKQRAVDYAFALMNTIRDRVAQTVEDEALVSPPASTVTSSLLDAK